MAKTGSGVPQGQYDYSTSNQESQDFNQGGDVSSPGASSPSYDYSAKGRAAAMYRMTGNTAPNTAAPSDYSASKNAADMVKRQQGGN